MTTLFSDQSGKRINMETVSFQELVDFLSDFNASSIAVQKDARQLFETHNREIPNE